MSLGIRALLAGSGLWVCAAAGCNAIFGVSPGVLAGEGGAGGSHPSGGHGGGGGGCDIFAGDALTYFTDMPTANVPTMMMNSGTSVSGTYYPDGDYTEFKLGSTVAGYCDIGTQVDLAGKPQKGAYTLVGISAATTGFASGLMTAYVFASAIPRPTDGGSDCDAIPSHGFGSVAGTGSVNITDVSENKVSFTVTGVQATGIDDSMCAGMGFPCDGTGTIQIDIKNGHSDCFETANQ